MSALDERIGDNALFEVGCRRKWRVAEAYGVSQDR